MNIEACAACRDNQDIVLRSQSSRPRRRVTRATTLLVVEPTVMLEEPDCCGLGALAAADARQTFYLARYILDPLGVPERQARVTSLVRCPFKRPPEDLASERGCSLAEVIDGPASNCVNNLNLRIRALGVTTVVAVGDVVYRLLKRYWRISAGPLERVFGTVVETGRAPTRVDLIPCAGIDAFTADDSYQPQRVRLQRLGDAERWTEPAREQAPWTSG